jgi:carbamoyltransferase
MMTTILGISAFYHDSAAAIVVDGRIVAAAQEERFTRIKHDPAFPKNAVDYCLAEAGVSYDEIDYVGFYDKPLVTFERLLETFLAVAPRGFGSFCKAIPVWLKQKLRLPKLIRQELGGKYKRRIIFAGHHESHAASAFFPSPFEEAAILTLDGVGEWSTATTGVGSKNRIDLQHELRFPHSLGLLYSAFTSFCGFKVNSGEYKLMGLAPYGNPKFVDLIRDQMMDLKPDGSFRLNMKYFDYCHGNRMPSRKFEELFGVPFRQSESTLTQDYMDIAASIQKVTEEIALRLTRDLQSRTGQKNLVMAGGVALNCVANGRLLRETDFDNIWIQPAAGDAGGALGVALLVWHQLLNNNRAVEKPDAQSGSYLGPSFSSDEIEAVLKPANAIYQSYSDESELCDRVAELLASENVVGWFQGRMEFGPRALGGRSILGDARSKDMQSVMNQKIKFRESFRPFAPSILRDHVHEYFETRKNEDSPYMLLVADVKKEHRLELSDVEQANEGIDLLNLTRSTIPAITHVDFSARIQTVDSERHSRYYDLLKAFHKKTNSPVLINTSFNVRGEPIVCTPEDAYRCFLATDMDVLVLENCVLLKKEQPNANANLRADYLKRFKLD